MGFTTFCGFSCSLIKSPLELQRISDCSGLSFRSENPLFGTPKFQWLHPGHDICLSRVSVAADYSDSVPSSGNVTHDGYHPLEELRDQSRVRDAMPTSVEIARSAVEANNKALLIFPSFVHCEPHQRISWSEVLYVIDEFGDMYFEINDDQNILEYRGTHNLVTGLIGMDISHYKSRNKKMSIRDDGGMEIDFLDDIFAADEYLKDEDSDLISAEWRMPEGTHPLYFAKCLTKVIDVEHAKIMDCPSNGISFEGFLRPIHIDDDEIFLRQLFSEIVDSHGNPLEYYTDDGSFPRSTIYKLVVTKMELYTVYGVQSEVDTQHFTNTDPDILVHSTPSILKRFKESRPKCNIALKALCKKKGLSVERANIIGVDSLGMDVRVSSGTEVRTYRFPFKNRAISHSAAEKQIQQLLYPPSQRKKLGTLNRPTNVN